MDEIPFHKMHGLGNDFVVIDNRSSGWKLNPKIMKSIADRRLGIGCDQVIVLNPCSDCDAEYQFFNADGSEAEQCGNGQRCIAYFLYLSNDQSRNSFIVNGLAGRVTSTVYDIGNIKVSMGKVKSLSSQQVNDETIYDVDLGNPHKVIVKDSIDSLNLTELKSLHCKTDVNFEIVQIIGPDHIKIRVHERGTGETQACGSGACATVAALSKDYNLNKQVQVSLPGGDLMIEYLSDNNSIMMTGPACYVFQGTIKL